MISKGVGTLADIARALDTTPQAVSNWKSRDQVPHHIAYKINNDITRHVAYKIDNENFKIDQSKEDRYEQQSYPSSQIINYKSNQDDLFSFSDIILKITQQTKVIGLTFFLMVFFSVTYTKFIKEAKYVSKATFLIPNDSQNPSGSLSGLASQFGVSMQTAALEDLSSPSIIPDLLYSRTFITKIINKKFYSKTYNKFLPLHSIIQDKNDQESDMQSLSKTLDYFLKNVRFEKDPTRPLSVLTISTHDPILSKNLADTVISELELLNKYYKTKNTNEKTKFIQVRIQSVKSELERNEKNLEKFNESNQQITSPSLQLEFERINREVEVQKRVFLTLKEQLELSRIEQIQRSSIFQILDEPQLPLEPSNKNIRSSIISSSVLGILMGLLLAFVRSYLNSNNLEERRKIRKIKGSLIKKSKDFVLDYRMLGAFSLSFVAAFPFYIGYESKNPIYFDRYSGKLMIFITLYSLITIFLLTMFYFRFKKQRSK
tara:strand:- start:55275 stop:56738 length:1464 start_codon:yes stop_codon:yes gene_type:complete